MPPKKKPIKKPIRKKQRKVSPPLQKQTQKQIVNIKIGDRKPKRKQRRRKPILNEVRGSKGSPFNLGNTLNMGVYSDLSRLNTLENLINRLLPEKISKPLTSSIQSQTSMLGTGTTTDQPLSQVAFMTELEDRATRPSPSETAKRTPIKTTPPPKSKRGSSISSVSSDEETMSIARRGTDYLSTGTDRTDLGTIDEDLGVSGFGDL